MPPQKIMSAQKQHSACRVREESSTVHGKQKQHARGEQRGDATERPPSGEGIGINITGDL